MGCASYCGEGVSRGRLNFEAKLHGTDVSYGLQADFLSFSGFSQRPKTWYWVGAVPICIYPV